MNERFNSPAHIALVEDVVAHLNRSGPATALAPAHFDGVDVRGAVLQIFVDQVLRRIGDVPDGRREAVVAEVANKVSMAVGTLAGHADWMVGDLKAKLGD
jgi:hypothetical protein